MARRNLRRLYTLTQQPEGPTGRVLDSIADDIVETARENAGKILHHLVAKHPEVLNLIEARRRGNEIIIGIRPDRPAGTNNIAYYLAQKEAREHIWLQPAVEEAMFFHRIENIPGGPGFNR